MSRTTMGCVLYFLAIDATDSPVFTLCSETRTRSSGLSSSRFLLKASAASRGSSRKCGPAGSVAQRWKPGLSSYTSSSVMPASSAASVRSSWPPVSTLREVGLVGNRAERDAVVLGIRHEAAHGHQLRHVGARFRRQAQAEEVHAACRARDSCSLRAARGTRRSCRRRWLATSRRRIRRACTAGSRARRAWTRARRGGRRTTSPA